MDVTVAGKRVRLNDSDIVGQGGEATVYRDGSEVIKIYKRQDHVDFDGNPDAQREARDRLIEHQTKLPDLISEFSGAFPSEAHVVLPTDLVRSNGGEIIGYKMPMIFDVTPLSKLNQLTFRRGGGVTSNDVIEVFGRMCRALTIVHDRGMVVGDFNDLNVLLSLGNAPILSHLIDVDSWQFGGYLCHMFTVNFVDPILCDPDANAPMMVRPHNVNSDVYAFTTMLFRSLLMVDPFGGIYRPAEAADRVPQSARKIHRISILHDDVGYPGNAVNPDVLPDELLQHFVEVFEDDLRGEFPVQLLDDLRWTECANCGTEHARRRCPNCARSEISVTEVQAGEITIENVFRTSGVILTAKRHRGNLVWLYSEAGEFRREDGRKVCDGVPETNMRYAVSGDSTYIGMGRRLMEFHPGREPRSYTVDKFEGMPAFSANQDSVFWSHSNLLYTNDEHGGAKSLMSLLSGRTVFWTGEEIGLAFYRAGEAQRAVIFDVERSSHVEVTGLPRISGHLLDADCTFSKDRCWFSMTIREGGRTLNRCAVISSGGEVEAVDEVDENDLGWLGSIRGNVASKNGMFSATDAGLVHVVTNGGAIEVSTTFDDTVGIVDSSCRLYPGRGGELYVIRGNRIFKLTL